MNKKELKLLAEDVKNKFSRFIGKEVRVSFGPHSFVTILLDIVPGKAMEVQSLIDKVEREDGTSYTPLVIKFVFEDGNMFFTVEDMQVTYLLDSIEIGIGDLSWNCSLA